MRKSACEIVAKVSTAGIVVRVVGASGTAASVSTVLIAAGAAVALGFAGYGLCRYLSSRAETAGSTDMAHEEPL